MSNKYFAFSGRMGAGKDYVAKQAGLTIVGFADPIYLITKYLYGTDDKSVPGIREAMQMIGQVGWGCVNDKYPASQERALFVDMVRRVGPTIMAGDTRYEGQEIDWSLFGRSKSFWVDILLGRRDIKDGSFGKTGLVVTNVRFNHELEPLSRHGFKHMHVMASLPARIDRLGTGWSAKNDNDTSEQLAINLDEKADDSKVIWNDVPTVCPRRNPMCIDRFREMLMAA